MLCIIASKQTTIQQRSKTKTAKPLWSAKIVGKKKWVVLLPSGLWLQKKKPRRCKDKRGRGFKMYILPQRLKHIPNDLIHDDRIMCPCGHKKWSIFPCSSFNTNIEKNVSSQVPMCPSTLITSNLPNTEQQHKKNALFLVSATVSNKKTNYLTHEKCIWCQS